MHSETGGSEPGAASGAADTTADGADAAEAADLLRRLLNPVVESPSSAPRGAANGRRPRPVVRVPTLRRRHRVGPTCLSAPVDQRPLTAGQRRRPPPERRSGRATAWCWAGDACIVRA